MPTPLSPIQADWVPIYRRFADRLLDFADDRSALLEHIRSAYRAAGRSLPMLEREGYELRDICPFTVLGLFNRRPNTSANRSSILLHLQRELGLPEQAPTSFEGIPTFHVQRGTVYYFIGDRGQDDIQHLWDLFAAAIHYADESSEQTSRRFIELYHVCQKQKGVKWNLSIAFFWMRPQCYLSLDGKTRWYLTNSVCPNEQLSQVPSAQQYLKLCERVKEEQKIQEFTGLVRLALHEADSENERRKQSNDGVATPPRKILQLTVENGVYHVDIDISSEEWKEMLQDRNIFSPEALNMVLEWYRQPGHQASNKEVMADTHPGRKSTPYNGIVIGLGKRIVRHLQRFEVRDTTGKGSSYFCIPFEGWHGEHGDFIWKLRDELAEAIRELHLADEAVEDSTPLAAAEPEPTMPVWEAYTEEDFLNEVYLSRGEFETMRNQLLRKKNIILQGAPGVGKTFCAERLAWALMGCKDCSRIRQIQFHAGYSYEDFMLGYRPNGQGFELKKGPFYQSCQQAAADPERPYFFIIDEMNRGNLNKIFGELFVLLESSYRGRRMQLMYGSEEFAIPENLHLIGMMNTADRSLALLDFALRRRFAFFELEPAFDSAGFTRWRESASSRALNRLVETVKSLNQCLDKGFRIGHSFFCGLRLEEALEPQLAAVVNHELIPQLEEYWFDEPERVQEWAERLSQCLQG